MSTPESVRDLAETISNSSNNVYSLTATGDAPWWNFALTDIAVILGDSPVVFTDVNVEWGAENDALYTATITVFSNTLIITSVASREANGAFARKTTARPRNELRALEVKAPTPAFDTRMGSQWPGRLTVVLTYGDRTISLPSTGSEPRQYLRLSEIVPSLAADLS